MTRFLKLILLVAVAIKISRIVPQSIRRELGRRILVATLINVLTVAVASDVDGWMRYAV